MDHLCQDIVDALKSEQALINEATDAGSTSVHVTRAGRPLTCLL